MKIAMLLLAVAAAPLVAQEPVWPANLEALSSHAKESVKVTLDGPLLQLAARFIPDEDSHSAALKKVIAGIQGIYVRSLEFGAEGDYSAADVDAWKAQFHDSSWAQIVGVKSQVDGETEVYLRSVANGKLAGIAVIVAEPRELTLVRIVGEISPEQLVALSGEFHMPRLHLTGHSIDKEWK